MIAYQLLTSCFVLTAYGADLGPPLGFSSTSASEALTNVSAYQTPQSTAEVVVGLTGFTSPVSPDTSRQVSQLSARCFYSSLPARHIPSPATTVHRFH
jgi:hypothetical protein